MLDAAAFFIQLKMRWNNDVSRGMLGTKRHKQKQKTQKSFCSGEKKNISCSVVYIPFNARKKSAPTTRDAGMEIVFT